MTASELNRAELLKENRRMLKNIERSATKIIGEELTSPLVSDLLDLQERLTGDRTSLNVSSIRKALVGLSEKNLRTVYRDLRYMHGLKTRGIRSARTYSERISPILNKYDKAWTQTQKDKFKEVYRKLLEAGASGDIFRYAVLELAEYAVDNDIDPDEFPVRAELALQELLKLKADDDDIEIGESEFLSKLQSV